METYRTLHEFLLHTESLTYILMGVSLPVILWFWIFLNGRDEE